MIPVREGTGRISKSHLMVRGLKESSCSGSAVLDARCASPSMVPTRHAVGGAASLSDEYMRHMRRRSDRARWLISHRQVLRVPAARRSVQVSIEEKAT